MARCRQLTNAAATKKLNPQNKLSSKGLDSWAWVNYPNFKTTVRRKAQCLYVPDPPIWIETRVQQATETTIQRGSGPKKMRRIMTA